MIDPTQRPDAPEDAASERVSDALTEAAFEEDAALLIEIGWVIAGRMDAVDLTAVHQARAGVLSLLEEEFPAFVWRMPVVHRRESVHEGTVQPVMLIDQGVAERDNNRWDFALVVTGYDLKAHYKPYALGAPATSVDVAVLSTAFIDPARHGMTDDRMRVDAMAHRITALALHLFGHLNDLPHAGAVEDFMFDLQTIGDLDAMQAYGAESRKLLEEALHQVADVRLEEMAGMEWYRRRTLLFYLRAAWMGRYEILNAVWHSGFWEYPFRLSRFTTAAASTMLILILTAEAWDLGMSQPAGMVLGISLAALGSTSVFIIKRQKILTHRRGHRLSEQRVIGQISMVIAVVLGMATVYGMLFSVTLILSRVLFGPHLVEGWAASLQGQIRFENYLILSGFVASLGLTIGALGASFEQQDYFRHITFIDEET